VVDERWQAHRVLNPKEASTKGSLLSFRNKIIKEMYEEESAQVKAEVKRRRDEEEASEDEMGADEDDLDVVDPEERKRQAKAQAYQR